MSLNRCDFIGRLTDDPKVAKVKNGTLDRALFSLAVEQYWRDEDNHKRSHVDFIDFIAWSGNARLVQKFVRKGQRIYVTGALNVERWQDEKTQEWRRRVQVVVNRIVFLDRSRRGRRDDEESDGNASPDVAPGTPS